MFPVERNSTQLRVSLNADQSPSKSIMLSDAGYMDLLYKTGVYVVFLTSQICHKLHTAILFITETFITMEYAACTA